MSYGSALGHIGRWSFFELLRLHDYQIHPHHATAAAAVHLHFALCVDSHKPGQYVYKRYLNHD